MKKAEKNRRKYAKCKIRNILRVCIRENQQFTKGMICRAQMLSQEDETVREWWMMTLAKKNFRDELIMWKLWRMKRRLSDETDER